MANAILNPPTFPAPGGSSLWTLTQTPAGCATTPVITTPATPNTTVTQLLCAGVYGFTYTVTNPGCSPVGVQMFVTVDPAPNCNPGSDANYCGGLTGTMGAYPEGVPSFAFTGLWTQASGPGTTVFADNTSPTTNISVSMYGTYVYNWAITPTDPANVCGGCNKTVTITFGTAPSANAGSPDSICFPAPAMQYCPPHVAVGLNKSQPSGTLTAYQNVHFPNTPRLSSTSGGGLTAGGWFMPECPMTNSPVGQQLMTKGGISIALTISGKISVSDGILTPTSLTSPAGLVTCGQWNQIIYRLNTGTNTEDVLINGVVVVTRTITSGNSTTLAANIAGDTSDLVVGGTNGSNSFRGNFASLIWQNSPISDALIAGEWDTNNCPPNNTGAGTLAGQPDIYVANNNETCPGGFSIFFGSLAAPATSAGTFNNVGGGTDTFCTHALTYNCCNPDTLPS